MLFMPQRLILFLIREYLDRAMLKFQVALSHLKLLAFSINYYLDYKVDLFAIIFFDLVIINIHLDL